MKQMILSLWLLLSLTAHQSSCRASLYITLKTEMFVPFPDDTPVATAKNMPGDSADLFGDGGTEDGSATNGRLWRTVIIGEQEHRIDLQMIKPYMRVVTHGGEGEGSLILAWWTSFSPSLSSWRGCRD